MPARKRLPLAAIALALTCGPTLACDALATGVTYGTETAPRDTGATPFEAVLDVTARVLMACQALPAGILPCGLPAGAMAGATMATFKFLPGTR